MFSLTGIARRSGHCVTICGHVEAATNCPLASHASSHTLKVKFDQNKVKNVNSLAKDQKLKIRSIKSEVE